MPGVFIGRGMTTAVQSFSIQAGEDGSLTPSLNLLFRYDVWPTWISVALGHLTRALDAEARRLHAWRGTDDEAKFMALEAEFEASMQATVASAIALDAFYAVLRTHVKLPALTIAAWRRNRTARHAQVATIIAAAFRLTNDGARTIKASVKEIYRLRDKAVHPAGIVEPAVYHPELDVGVEWRFVLFRAAHARAIVNDSPEYPAWS